MENIRRDVIYNLEETIRKIYQDNHLESLRGYLKQREEQKGENLYSDYFDIIRFSPNKKQDYYTLIDDILYCSDEILYFTAHLYLYLPYINDPIKDSFDFDGNRLYPNYENLESKRFSMYANMLFQSAYNYWDRIGDLIASFFPNDIKEKNVDFVRSLNEIKPLKTNYKNSENYIWLKNFQEVEYSSLNKTRINVVHYISLNSHHKNKYREIVKVNKEQVEKMMFELRNYPDYFKKHIDLTFQGFEKTLLLLKEIIK